MNTAARNLHGAKYNGSFRSKRGIRQMEKSLWKNNTAPLSPGVFVLVTLLSFCSGCGSADREFERRFGVDAPRPVMVAVRTDEPVKIDGVLSEKAWQYAPAYSMHRAYRNFDVFAPKTAEARKSFPADSGEVRILYDDKNLYISAKLCDFDVVQFGSRDQELLYNTGDLFEIFVKSEKSPRYLECYIAPNGRKTTLVHLTRNYPRANWGKLDPAYRAAASVDGSLNHFADQDRGWSAEAAIPFAMIEKITGEKFPGSGGWTVFFGRYHYNYGSGMQPGTGAPQLPLPGFHQTEYYAELRFDPNSKSSCGGKRCKK